VEKFINQNRKKGTPTTQIDRFFSSCKTKTSATQLEHSFCASTVTCDDIFVMTPTLEDETNTSALGMTDEVLAVKTDEASTSPLALQISRDISDLQSVPTESQPEKVTSSGSTLADKLVTSTSALDAGSTSVPSSTPGEIHAEENNQVFWLAPPTVKN